MSSGDAASQCEPRSEWLPLLLQCLQQHSQVVRVVVANVRGSAPREAGATLIVTPQAVHGTIGGGRLEWEVLHSARSLLRAATPQAVLRKFVLGTELAQCCGGVVDVWLELHACSDREQLLQAWQHSESGPVELCSTLLPSNRVRRHVQRASGQRTADAACASLRRAADGEITLVERVERAVSLWLYGAGHVGRAVVRIAAQLPWQITWIDSRAELLAAEGHAQVRTRCSAEPADTVQQAPPGACFLIMTHSHALDYALCRAALDRDAAAWVGLIGSHSKSARFRAQLRRDGVALAQIERLVCPIGIAGLRDKHPAAIAVSVVAQLLQNFQYSGPVVMSPVLMDEPCTQSCSSCTTSGALS